MRGWRGVTARQCVTSLALGCGALSALAACGDPLPPLSGPPPVNPVDLREAPHLRVFGLRGTGERGTPIAGGRDIDGDGAADFVIASFMADPPDRAGVSRVAAGVVAVVFGDGQLSGEIDASVPSAQVLHIYGANYAETLGNEVWVDDVTGDGLADVLIGRQNFTQDLGAGVHPGAVSVVPGGPGLRDLPDHVLDLGAAPAAGVTTLVGEAHGDRFGIWLRTGDVSGDGIADLVVGADQRAAVGGPHVGAAFVLRGGAWLASGTTQGVESLPADQRLRLEADLPEEAHFGATCQLADLDGDGLSEALVAATIERAGAGVPPNSASAKTTHARGGVKHGAVWIFDARKINEAWSAGLSSLSSAVSVNGSALNVRFGEEIAGLGDLDGDGAADLLFGDIISNGAGVVQRPGAGSAHVLLNAGPLVNRQGAVSLDQLRAEGRLLELVGAASGDITGDTAVGGDFDGDGLADLALSSPHAHVETREMAGVVHVVFGAAGLPRLVDLADPERGRALTLVEVLGAQGARAGSQGDVLGYSAAAFDVDGDGLTDLLLNEMLGDGPAGADTGNLVVLSGQTLKAARPRVR